MKNFAFAFAALIAATVGCGPKETSSDTKSSMQSSDRTVYDYTMQTSRRARPNSFCGGHDCVPATQRELQASNVQILSGRVADHRPAIIYLGLVAKAVNKGYTVSADRLHTSAQILGNNGAANVYPVINGETRDDTAAVETLRSFHSEVGLNEDALACAQIILEGGSCD